MRLIYCLLLTILSNALIAQNEIPNPGFEDWETGGGVFSSYEDPVDWGTLNSSSSILGINTVTKATAPQYVNSGNSALRLETFFIELVNRPAQGTCVTGTINTTTEEIDGGVAYNLRPSTFEGWYQYYPLGADTATLTATFSKWNETLGQREVVGFAGKIITAQADVYTEFIVPVEFFTEENPDTMIVSLVCSSLAEPGIGTVMYIDDLNLTFTTVDVAENTKGKAVIYPNPTKDFINFDVTAAGSMQIRNAAGAVVKSGMILQGQNRWAIENLPVGSYFSEFFDVNGNRTGIERWMLVK